MNGRRGIIGSPATVVPKLLEVADQYGAQELIVVTITHDHQARRRSYELIAGAIGLEPPTAAGAKAADANVSADDGPAAPDSTSDLTASPVPTL